MPPIFIIIWIVWFTSEVYLNIFMRAAKDSAENHDKNSISRIWLIILASVGLAVLAVNFTPVPIARTTLLNYAGLLMIIFGIVLRFLAIRLLGKFFTVNLALHHDHKLIRTGLFKYIRHPSYTGLLLSFIGLGLSLNNWISLSMLVAPILFIMLKRIEIEEKMLIKQFGNEYLEYQKKTWRLIPGIF